MKITKIISGGQVGADRAGLDFAIAHRIPHGGWCPKGRRAEDGVIPAHYNLVEGQERNYQERTRLNVENSDGTVIFSVLPLTPGSFLTRTFCQRLGKPFVLLCIDEARAISASRLDAFLKSHPIKVLNVAGSRQEDFYAFAYEVLTKWHSSAVGQVVRR